MAIVLAFVVGSLYGAAVYLLLRRSIVKLLFGLVLLGHGTNLLIFTTGGLTRAHAPIIPEVMQTPQEAVANPLPQALILTAIVIGFGVQAFMLVLLHRSARAVKTDDVDDMTSTDRTS
jgi:multicomponent Na+:H+ antiporter subunit C